MRIMRVADENLAPKWVFDGPDAPEFSKSEYITSTEAQRIASMSDAMDEDAIVEEREVIEKCSDSGEIYRMNSAWSNPVKSSLREYASVCGIDRSKVQEVDASSVTVDMDTITKNAETSQGLTYEAQAETVESPETFDVDPFRLDEKALTNHMDEADWETVGKQSNMEDAPSIMSGAIKPLRGGEDYFVNSDVPVGRGRNSIADPNAIGELVESETPDTRTRLRAEAEDRESAREQEREDWEEEKITAMKGNQIIPSGSVFMTEAMDAQSGLGESKTRPGIYSKSDPNDLPDRTAGEMLAEQNDQSRKAIQRRDSSEDRGWESLKPSETRGISDSFTEALKSALNK